MSGLLALALTGGAAASAKFIKKFKRRTVFCISHFVIGCFLCLAGWCIHIHKGIGAFICLFIAQFWL